MRPITAIQAPGTKRPLGHYSQAVVHAGLVYVSGQLPTDLESGIIRAGTVSEQTERVLGNLARVLEAAGSGLERLVQVTVYLADIAQWPAVNAIYARVMGSHRPARAMVPVTSLHNGVEIEIQAIATVGHVARPEVPASSNGRRRAPVRRGKKVGRKATPRPTKTRVTVRRRG